MVLVVCPQPGEQWRRLSQWRPSILALATQDTRAITICWIGSCRARSWLSQSEIAWLTLVTLNTMSHAQLHHPQPLSHHMNTIPQSADIPVPIDARPRSPLFLHGRQMPRLLHNHHRLLARPNCRHLRWLLDCSMSANGRQGAID